MKIYKITYVFFYRNDKVIKLEPKDFKFVKPIKPAKKIFTKFITFDVETRTIDNQLILYCICIFDGKSTYLFYLS